MAQPRYITTLIRRLNAMEPIEPKFDYGDTERARARREQITAALTFWRFYENLFDEHTDGIKNLPEGRDTLRHELLERVASENTFRGFVARWLRLPVTVVETLKWSANLDIQSRESFLRRLEPRQLKAVREAYNEFFVHRVRPTCLNDGPFRRLVHAGVTYESLLREPLLSSKRTESKCAWSKNVAHLDFGHAKYPQGPADDAADSGAFRKFFSVKNHEHDFAVNQHDGLYWFFYRTLRSNYLWNRDGDVELHPMICPGFWFTLIGWLFFTLISPLLAATVTFPAFAGQVGLSFFTFVGFVLGAVTPLLLVLMSIFYIWRDTRFIGWLSRGIDNHFDRFGEVWVWVFKALWFSFLSLVFVIAAYTVFATEELFLIHALIPVLWLGVYWYLCLMDGTVGPSLEENGRLIVYTLVVSVLMAGAPYWKEIFSGIALLLKFLFLALTMFGLQLIMFALIVGAAFVVGKYAGRLKEFQRARSGVTTERFANEQRFLTGIIILVSAFYGGLIIWAGYHLLTTDSLTWALVYPVAVLLIVLAFSWFVYEETHEVQRVDPDLVLKRNAYINALREAGEWSPSSYLHLLMDNDWVVTHEDPVGTAKEVQAFVNRLTHHLDKAGGLRMNAALVIDGDTQKRFGDYTDDVVRDAYYQLHERYYGEFVRRACEGFTPEQALKKAFELKDIIEGRRTFWYDSFPVRMLEAVIGFFEAIWFGIGKIFRDLFGMWDLFHRYCPAVSEQKQI